MTLATFIDFVMRYNVEIIQWLMASILGVTLLYILIRILYGAPTAGGSAGVDTSEVAESIKTLVQQIQKNQETQSSTGSQAGVIDAASGGTPMQVEELKKKEAEIIKLSEELKATKEAAPDVSGFKNKIAELEAKLAEYEILEDDIADLSLYKEENEKLKVELDKLRGSFSGDAPAPAPTAPPAVNGQPQAVPVPPAAGGAAAPNDLVAEFEAAVGAEKAPAAPTPVVEATAPAATAPSPAPAASAPAPAPAPPANDLFAEFSASPTQTPVAATPSEVATPIVAETPAAPVVEATAPAATAPSPAPAASAPTPAQASAADPLAESHLNTEKMLEEMAQLVSVAPSDGSSLDESIDTEKMASEALSMGAEKSS